MSYDYTLFKAPGPGPMDTWAAVDPDPLGTIEDLQARLSEVFPRSRWQLSGDWWSGHSSPEDDRMEFQARVDADGLCRFVIVRRVTRPELERLCHHLGVLAVDNQTVEVVRP